MTINLAIDSRRRRRTEQQTAVLPEHIDRGDRKDAPQSTRFRLVETADRSVATWDGIDQEKLRDDVSVALGGLTDVQRTVLISKVYDEMTFARIAAELELAVSTVKTHYLRALRAVGDRLQPRWSLEE